MNFDLDKEYYYGREASKKIRGEGGLNFFISLKSVSKGLLWFKLKKCITNFSHYFDQTSAGGGVW